MSVRDQIKKLIEIQKFDKEIFDLKQEKASKPAIIDNLKQEFETKKAGLRELEEKFKRIQMNRDQHELELKEKEGGITKANTQLSNIKTNKEYTAKIKEIESLKADKSIVEEKILESYDEVDTVNAEIAKEKAKVAEQEKHFQEKKKKLEGDVKEIDDRLRVLESQRSRLIPDIDPHYLSQYERILNHKEGLAIVPIQNDSCSGCFMNVTHQMVNAIKMHDQMVSCETCNRFLYLEDDL